MTKAYDKISAGLDDIAAGRYTIVRQGDEPVPPAAETERDAVARVIAERRRKLIASPLERIWPELADAALAASAKWHADIQAAWNRAHPEQAKTDRGGR